MAGHTNIAHEKQQTGYYMLLKMQISRLDLG